MKFLSRSLKTGIALYAMRRCLTTVIGSLANVVLKDRGESTWRNGPLKGSKSSVAMTHSIKNACNNGLTMSQDAQFVRLQFNEVGKASLDLNE